jgi:hypothetical protein
MHLSLEFRSHLQPSHVECRQHRIVGLCVLIHIKVKAYVFMATADMDVQDRPEGNRWCVLTLYKRRLEAVC